ncbi:MAG: hypothetical protein ACR2LC_02710 [Pyrinomonadaceae bacterium]
MEIFAEDQQFNTLCLVAVSKREIIMNRERYGLLLLLVIIASLASATVGVKLFTSQPVQAQQVRSAKKNDLGRQEVSVVFSDTRRGLVTEANRMGEQGWELVSVIIDESSGPGNRYTAYLKRSKP